MERAGVEMVRLEQPEEVFDVEAVLGRDASSVFPSMHKDLDPMEQLKTAIGAKRFVTESELEAIKAARGLHVDDGTIAADKPLAEILADKKKAKQDAFDDQWKQMKTGKNRPLEPDELEFLDSLAEREAEQQRQISQQEAVELEVYRQAVAAAAEAKAAAAASAAAGGAEGGDPDAFAAGAAAAAAGSSGLLGRSGSDAADKAAAGGSSRPASKPKAVVPVIKPILKVKPKAAGQAAAGAGAAAKQQDSNRQRLEESKQQQQQQQSGGGQAGLQGLLGGYGSGSDSDS